MTKGELIARKLLKSKISFMQAWKLVASTEISCVSESTTPRASNDPRTHVTASLLRLSSKHIPNRLTVSVLANSPMEYSKAPIRRHVCAPRSIHRACSRTHYGRRALVESCVQVCRVSEPNIIGIRRVATAAVSQVIKPLARLVEKAWSFHKGSILRTPIQNLEWLSDQSRTIR